MQQTKTTKLSIDGDHVDVVGFQFFITRFHRTIFDSRNTHWLSSTILFRFFFPRFVFICLFLACAENVFFVSRVAYFFVSTSLSLLLFVSSLGLFSATASKFTRDNGYHIKLLISWMFGCDEKSEWRKKLFVNLCVRSDKCPCTCVDWNIIESINDEQAKCF